MTSATPQQADLKSHPIEGFTRHGNKFFSVPLMSHIEGNLYMGGCPVGAAPDEIKFIVNLFPWGEYTTNEHQIVTTAHLFDSSDLPDENLLYTLAAHVATSMQAGKVLVHCQAGLNRSGLICALALNLRGMAPADAIALLREKRSDAVLCNDTFEKWLLNRPSPQLTSLN